MGAAEFFSSKVAQGYLKASSLRLAIAGTSSAGFAAVALLEGWSPQEAFAWAAIGLIVPSIPLSLYFSPKREIRRKMKDIEALRKDRTFTAAQDKQARDVAYRWYLGAIADGEKPDATPQPESKRLAKK